MLTWYESTSSWEGPDRPCDRVDVDDIRVEILRTLSTLVVDYQEGGHDPLCGYDGAVVPSHEN